MKPIIRTLSLAALLVIGAGSAFAQPGPYWHRHGSRYWHGQVVYPGVVRSPGGYVIGPAYGRSGEPLGPAYWSENWWPSDPSTCGPGACQDNPRY